MMVAERPRIGAPVLHVATLLYLLTLPPVSGYSAERFVWWVAAFGGIFWHRAPARVWWCISALLAARTAYAWSVLENHAWLLVIWAVLLALYPPVSISLGERSKDGQAHHGICVDAERQTASRLLLGSVFFIAAMQKLLSVDYMSGQFFEVYIYESSDIRSALQWLGLAHVPTEFIDASLGSFDLEGGGPNATEWTLRRQPEVILVARILTYWTLLMEFALAATWLFPVPYMHITGPSTRWMSLTRTTLLTVFLLTTYLTVPVWGFAALLVLIAMPHVTLRVFLLWCFILCVIALRRANVLFS